MKFLGVRPALDAADVEIIKPVTGNITLNCAGGIKAYDLTFGANSTITLTGAVSGAENVIIATLRQDDQGGRTITLPSNIVWSNDFAPTVTKEAGRFDTYIFRTTDAGNAWEGAIYTSSATVPLPPGLPSRPRSLTLVPSDGKITISWSVPLYNNPASTSYKIYRKITGVDNNFVLIHTLSTGGSGAASFSYENTGLTNGVVHAYRVSAVNSYGEGEQCDERSDTPRVIIRALQLSGISGCFAYLPKIGQPGAPPDNTSYDELEGKTLIEVWAKILPDAWSTSATQIICSRLTNQFHYYITAGGKHNLQTNPGEKKKDSATTRSDTSPIWLRAKLHRATSPANGIQWDYYVKTDGDPNETTPIDNLNWTTDGAALTDLNGAAIEAGDDAFVVGATGAGGVSYNFKGKIYKLIIWKGHTDLSSTNPTKILQVTFNRTADVESNGSFVANMPGDTGETWILKGGAQIGITN